MDNSQSILDGDYQLVTSHTRLADLMYFQGKQRERYYRERDFIDNLIRIKNLGKKIIDAGCGAVRISIFYLKKDMK